MSLHADHPGKYAENPVGNLIFERFQPPVTQMGPWPVKRPTFKEILHKHFPLVRKILGYSLASAYFLAIGLQMIAGPAPSTQKYETKTDFELAVMWVKS